VDEHSQRLRALVPKALDVIEVELGGERRLSAATYVLKTCGFHSLPVPSENDTLTDFLASFRSQL